MLRTICSIAVVFVSACKSSPEVAPSVSCEALRDKWVAIGRELTAKAVAGVAESNRAAVQSAGDAELEAIRTKFVGVCQSMGTRIDATCFDDAAALTSERCKALNNELSKQLF